MTSSQSVPFVEPEAYDTFDDYCAAIQEANIRRLKASKDSREIHIQTASPWDWGRSLFTAGRRDD